MVFKFILFDYVRLVRMHLNPKNYIEYEVGLETLITLKIPKEKVIALGE